MVNAQSAEIAKNLADALQAVATAAALAVGGVWTYLLFVRRRQKYPRAELTHTWHHALITHDKRLLRVGLSISNIGDVLIPLQHGELRLRQIVPPYPEVMQAATSGKDPVRKDSSEFEWPVVGIREWNWSEGSVEIEPGEKDIYHSDFILDAAIKTVEIASYFENTAKRRKGIGWIATSIVEFPESMTHGLQKDGD